MKEYEKKLDESDEKGVSKNHQCYVNVEQI